jgi:ABC-type multidrug transport system fused ATPase/permease subunit
MPIPERPTFDSPDPRWRICITDDGSPTLVQRCSDDAMHSGCGAVTETQHVYLQSSGVAHRLQQGLATRVLEVGFGAGLGWLLTADAALAGGAPLFYLALENRLPPAAVLQQLDLGRFVRCGDLLERYQMWLASLPCCGDGEQPAPATYRFVCRNVELQIRPGEQVGICGPTGGGRLRFCHLAQVHLPWPFPN